MPRARVARSTTDIKIQGADKLRRMARDLRAAGRTDLQRELGRAIQRAAKPTLDAIQRSARDIQTKGVPIPGARHPFTRPVPPKGTRQKIAQAVRAEVRISPEESRVAFRVDTSRLDVDLKSMPRHFDNGKWRHPVMGHKEVWVSQTSKPWFWPPIKEHIRTFRGEIDRALDTVRRKLEAGR